jgi:hypothetical protein
MNTLFIDLTWWQYALLAIYTLYTLFRAFYIFDMGLKDAIIGHGQNEVKLYHLLWSIVDIPAIVLGKLFPLIKFLFSVPILRINREKK